MTAVVVAPLAVKILFGAPILALLLGFFVFKPYKPEWTHLPILVSCACIAGSAMVLAAHVLAKNWGVDVPAYTWMLAGDWGFSLGIRVDGLSASVLAMVAVVGGLIHVYASEYMKGDPGFARFFLSFHLFFLAMIGLLLSNNFVQMYLFWELVGVCSYLLIGFWLHKKSARSAAMQAFMTNRVGDFGFLLAVLIIVSMPHGNARFGVVFPVLAGLDPNLLALAGFLLFWAATAKSAQFPLYFWLPDAMEGPTPVSALMHAATMVTAGIYLLARCWPLVSCIGNLPLLIAVVGAFTSIVSAIIAGTRKDLKRILAYSTVSHLGIMAFGLGLGAFAPAIFHLITHGFFKAVLFLCAGAIAHALHQPTASIEDVGGLWKKMPVTFACFLVASLSLAGIWPFAGYYSKDAILEAALIHGGWAAAAGVLISIGSAFYIFRMLFLAFFGPRKEQKGAPHVHEAPPAMAVPMIFLSLGALAVGWAGPVFSKMLQSGWMGREAVENLPPFSWHVFLAGTGAALVGAALAWWWTMAKPSFDWEWRASHPGLEAAFDSDLGWRRVVAFAARLVRGLATLAGKGFDPAVCDGVVEGSAAAAQATSQAASGLATGLLNDYVWWMAVGAAAVLFAALRW